MVTVGRMLSVGTLAVLMLAGFTTGALAQGATGGAGPGMAMGGGGARGLVEIQGTVVCANCDLREARETHPDQDNLYEFRHGEGKVVMQVKAVNNSAQSSKDEEIVGRWADIVQPHFLAVRAEDAIWQKVLDAQNSAQEIQITGLLHSSRTLDIADVVILQ